MKNEKNMVDANALERAFVELVARRVKERGWKKGEFAAAVWPEDAPKVAMARWTAMRSLTKTGKPQGVLISDAERMAQVFGEDLGYLLSASKEKLKDGLLVGGNRNDEKQDSDD